MSTYICIPISTHLIAFGSIVFRGLSENILRLGKQKNVISITLKWSILQLQNINHLVVFLCLHNLRYCKITNRCIVNQQLFWGSLM